MAGWILAHASLVSVLVTVLFCVVVLDHCLAASHLFDSNSTGQAFLKWIGIIFDWALKLLSPAVESQIPVINPLPAAVTAAVPAAQASPAQSQQNSAAPGSST